MFEHKIQTTVPEFNLIRRQAMNV